MRISAGLPGMTHLIDDSRNASIVCAAVNLINSVDRCLGGIAYSYHEGNLFPDDLSSVVLVLVSPSLSRCEQLGSLSAPDPKLVLLPKRKEIAGGRRQSGMPDLVFGGSGIVVVVICVRSTACRLDCDPPNRIIEYA